MGDGRNRQIHEGTSGKCNRSELKTGLQYAPKRRRGEGQVERGGGTGEGNEWENSGNRERLMKEMQSR